MAISSVAIPNIKKYVDRPEGIHDVNTQNKVVGYYLTGSYKLLGDDINEGFKLTPLDGIGYSKVEYSATETLSKHSKTPAVKTSEVNKNYFNYMVALETRIYISRNSSVAIVAEYIHIPDKTPVSVFSDESERPFGNFSLGMSLGIHL